MSTQRGRIRITGFDPTRVDERDALSDWVEEGETEPESRWRRAWRRFRRNRSAMLGVVVVTVLTLLALLARPIELFGVAVQPVSITPFEPDTILYLMPEYADIGPSSPPSSTTQLGTDGTGRDIRSRLLYGGRYSLSIGFIVVFITAVIGIIYVSIFGYFGRVVH